MVVNNAFILTEMKEKAIEEGIEKGIILSKREDILDNLSELGKVTDKIKEIVNKEENIDTLKLCNYIIEKM